jgi:hypothetical protein
MVWLLMGLGKNRKPLPKIGGDKNAVGLAIVPDWFRRTGYSHVKTERGLQNQFYEARAMGLLMNDPNFHWLCSSQEQAIRDTAKIRAGVLAELGRIKDDDDLRAVAAQICELKPKTKMAVAMIRRARLGKKKSGDVQDLARTLARCIDAYTETHSGITLPDVVQAVENLLDTVEDIAAQGE